MISAANKIVVGYDASDESQVALQWAVAVANRRQTPLLVVHATGVEDPVPTGYNPGLVVPLPQSGSIPQRPAQAVADEGARRAREGSTVDVEAVGIDGNAVVAIVGYSKEAELVVLGTRGRGRMRGVFMGSVAFAVTTHAACPVAVVRGSIRPLPSADYPIVVGVDGSEGSNAALDEAARLASETGATLRVTVAYATERAKQGSADTARTAAARVAEQYPDVLVENVVAAGRAEEVIVDAATDASLIVVGSRGRGEFAGLLLGSVSRDVMQRADCTVYVIR